MSSHFERDLSTIAEDGSDFTPSNRPSNLGNMYQSLPKPNVRFPMSSSHDMNFDPPQSYTGVGLEIASSVIGNLISHPCIVMRRQCQVNRKSLRYHLSPFSLIPVVIRLQNRQGVKALWKGAGGIFIIRGIAIGIETVIAEVTPFPREISAGSSMKHIVQHLLLKSITFGILTPFYCSSLMETVQSDIASDKPGVFDCLKEGVRRLFRWGTPQSTRLLPMWKLIGPTMAYGLMDYIITSVVRYIFSWIISYRLQREYVKHGAKERKRFGAGYSYFESLTSAFVGHVIAEVALFPAETVLNRLYLQGTRTIIDNLDSGVSVTPVITKYEGASDCFNTIVAEEGSMGLYKGFGALILEYSIQILILKSAAFFFQNLAALLASAKSERSQV